MCIVGTHDIEHIPDSASIIASLDVLDETKEHGVKDAAGTVLLGAEVGLPQKGEQSVTLEVDENLFELELQQIPEEAHN